MCVIEMGIWLLKSHDILRYVVTLLLHREFKNPALMLLPKDLTT